jgi:hypothetical protein
MNFGVIVCPQCNQVKGVDFCSKTTKCIRCGKTLQMKKLQIFYKTESQEKLHKAVGLMKAELEGKRDTFTKLLNNKNKLKQKQFK